MTVSDWQAALAAELEPRFDIAALEGDAAASVAFAGGVAARVGTSIEVKCAPDDEGCAPSVYFNWQDGTGDTLRVHVFQPLPVADRDWLAEREEVAWRPPWTSRVVDWLWGDGEPRSPRRPLGDADFDARLAPRGNDAGLALARAVADDLGGLAHQLNRVTISAAHVFVHSDWLPRADALALAPRMLHMCRKMLDATHHEPASAEDEPVAPPFDLDALTVELATLLPAATVTREARGLYLNAADGREESISIEWRDGGDARVDVVVSADLPDRRAFFRARRTRHVLWRWFPRVRLGAPAFDGRFLVSSDAPGLAEARAVVDELVGVRTVTEVFWGDSSWAVDACSARRADIVPTVQQALALLRALCAHRAATAPKREE